MWDEWESIASAQARADQQDAERREQRARPKPKDPPDDALRTTETTEQAVGWEATAWGAPRPSGRAVEANAGQRAVWEEEHNETVAALVALLRSFLPPTEDTDG